jgi:hypothetical protein
MLRLSQIQSQGLGHISFFVRAWVKYKIRVTVRSLGSMMPCALLTLGKDSSSHNSAETICSSPMPVSARVFHGKIRECTCKRTAGPICFGIKLPRHFEKAAANDLACAQLTQGG